MCKNFLVFFTCFLLISCSENKSVQNKIIPYDENVNSKEYWDWWWSLTDFERDDKLARCFLDDEQYAVWRENKGF